MNPRLKKILWLLIRVLISTLCVAYVISNTQWADRLDERGQVLSAGFLTTLSDVFHHGGWRWMILAVIAYFFSPAFGAWRWQWLLRVQGIRLTFAEACRLTYIGFFFNTFMPGVTGGDIVKAYYAAKATNRKAEAVATVLLDRLVGMVGMALLCLCALVVRWDDPAISSPLHIFHLFQISVRGIIVGFLALSVVGGVVFFSRRLRALLSVDWFMVRLPFQRIIGRLNEAVLIYRHHHNIVFLSILQSWAGHLAGIASVYFCALALGLDASPVYFLIYVPVIWIVASVVPTVGGLGAMEVLSQKFFTASVLGLAVAADQAASQALAIIILFRLAMFVAVLPGGVLNVLYPGVSLQEAESQVKDVEQSDG